jgi:tRNA acetyltransferase TAN1
MTNSKKRFHPSKGDTQQAKRARWIQSDLEAGVKGFFVSCVKGKERLSCKEVTMLLTDEIQRLHPEIIPEKSQQVVEEVKQAVEDSIADEISSLNERKDNQESNDSLFQPIAIGVDCLMFLKFKSDFAIDMEKVVNSLFSRILTFSSEKRVKTRFTQRIIPFQASSKSFLPEMKSTLTSLCESCNLKEGASVRF